MDRMLVVVFDNEVKAYEGKKGPYPTGCRGQHQRLCLRGDYQTPGWHYNGEAGG